MNGRDHPEISEEVMTDNHPEPVALDEKAVLVALDAYHASLPTHDYPSKWAMEDAITAYLSKAAQPTTVEATTLWRAEAETAMKIALEYLRGEDPKGNSGSHRNGDVRNRLKWVLQGCGGPLRSALSTQEPVQPNDGMVEALREKLDKLPRTDRGFSFDASNYMHVPELRIYGEWADAIFWVIENQDCLVAALSAPVQAGEAPPKDTARFKTLSAVDDEPAPAPSAGLVEREELDKALWRIREYIEDERLPDVYNAHPNDRDRFKDRHEDQPKILAEIDRLRALATQQKGGA